MNLFAPLEKLINEHGSAAIMKERLELLRDQFKALEDKNRELADNLRLAEAKVTVLEAENRDFRSKQEVPPTQIRLEPQTRAILTYLFEYGEDASADFVGYNLGIKTSIAEYHFDILKRHGFIRFKRPYMRTADIAPSGPSYVLTAEGRAAHMEITSAE